MKKQLLKILILCSIIIPMCFIDDLFAQSENKASPNSIFDQANILYKDSKYDQAIAKYEEIIKQGLVSGNLYYNLANAYFKKDELGRAILNYERAKLFIPSDGDLRSNYEYASVMLDLGSEKESKKWFVKLVDRFYRVFSVNALTVFLSLLYTLTFLIIVFSFYIPGLRRLNRFLVFILIVFFLAGSVSLAGKIADSKRAAIIIAKDVQAKFEPVNNATTYFKLNEGSKVEILAAGNNWYKIKRFDGKIGWISKDGVELISD